MASLAAGTVSLPVDKRLSRFFFQHPRLVLMLLLALPLLWLLVLYIGPLAVMAVQSLYSTDPFSGLMVKELSLQTYSDLFTRSNMEIVGRTVLMAAAVTIADAILAFPLSYYMARFAPKRLKGLMYLLVLLPLWSSYLVRVYSWKLILANEGVLNWFLETLHLGALRDGLLNLPVIGGSSLSFSYLGMFLVFVYIWLPYMILPINAALERVPRSLVEASSDLGARPGMTLRRIILPLALPGLVAGSIFTFSLTLGDYIIPGVIGNSSYFIGPAVSHLQGTNGNIPLAAALTVVPIVIMSIYLLIAKRLGAFDAL
ncbi:MAG TPA: ABC transporter permease [Aggregatilineales bacterium]|nr:ABC transporter permease [Aggregatilineales bacterium]